MMDFDDGDFDEPMEAGEMDTAPETVRALKKDQEVEKKERQQGNSVKEEPVG